MNEQTLNDKIKRLEIEVGSFKKSVVFFTLFSIIILISGISLPNQVSNMGIAFVLGVLGFLSIVLDLFSFVLFLSKRIKLNVLKSNLASGEYSEYLEAKKPITFAKAIKGALLMILLVLIGFPMLIFIISTLSSMAFNF